MGRGAYQAWGYEGENSGVTRDEFEAVAGDLVHHAGPAASHLTVPSDIKIRCTRRWPSDF